MMGIDLIWLGGCGDAPRWPAGKVLAIEATPRAVHALVEREAAASAADAWLFWDSSLGPPDVDRVREALQRPGDAWHAGLRLGMNGLPNLIDCVHPTWMLNRDPDPNIEATSWRLSLRACLIRTEVLRQMGAVSPVFDTLGGAALEMGHRYVRNGVLTRHVPSLLSGSQEDTRLELPLLDELRFSLSQFGPMWARWALARAVMSGTIPAVAALRSWSEVRASRAEWNQRRYAHPPKSARAPNGNARVTVLIPTIDRYPYLRTLLDQLRAQTIPASEIILVDQTPASRRDPALTSEFEDLPLRVIYQDTPGQCTARNAGLQVAKGEYILFLDDDDEAPPTLVEQHLRTLAAYGADVSAGVAAEVGAGALPEAFTFLRASDVFPTNNTMLHVQVLDRSGLFDLAYDRRTRADGDLGMRVYLGGDLIVLDPAISVLHHHAPAGGLRTHKARVITYASSRRRLTHRQLPEASEIYLAQRYFTPRQVREMLWIRTVGSFSIRGGPARKALKSLLGLLSLPMSLWRVRQTRALARTMSAEYPRIPALVE